MHSGQQLTPVDAAHASKRSKLPRVSECVVCAEQRESARKRRAYTSASESQSLLPPPEIARARLPVANGDAPDAPDVPDPPDGLPDVPNVTDGRGAEGFSASGSGHRALNVLDPSPSSRRIVRWVPLDVNWTTETPFPSSC